MARPEGDTYAQTRNQRRLEEKSVFDVQRSIYLESYQTFRDGNKPLVAVLKDQASIATELDEHISRSVSIAATHTDRVLQVEKQLGFVRSENQDLSRVYDKEKDYIQGWLDRSLRRWPFGTMLAETLFYPRNFMSAQFKRVERAVAATKEQQALANEGLRIRLDDLNKQAAELGVQVYDIESRWAVSGDEDRFINFTVDHPTHKEDLFNRYLAGSEAVSRRRLEELYTRYSQFVAWRATVVREKPENTASVVKAKVINPRARREFLIESLHKNSEVAEIDRPSGQIYYIPGVNSEPVLIEAAEEMELPRDHGDLTEEKIWEILSWIRETYKKDPNLVIQRYSRRVNAGSFDGWRKLGHGKKTRLIFTRTSNGDILFRVGDHEEVLGVQSNNKRVKI